jgi:hypothetical protein
MLYNSLLPFAGCDMIDKAADYEMRLEIKKYWGKLKINISYRGKPGDTIKDNIQPVLERFTAIPELIKELKMGAARRIENGSPEDNYSLFCEVRGGELFE